MFNTPICRLTYLFLLTMAILVSSCIPNTMDRTIGPKYFDLNAPWHLGTDWERDNIGLSKKQVFIMKPKVGRALSKNKIAFVSNGNQIGYFTDWHWSDELSNLIQAKIVEVFEHFFHGVGTTGQGVSIDYRIVTELRAFHLEETIKGNKGSRFYQCSEESSSAWKSKINENIEQVNENANITEGNDEEIIEYWAVVEIATKIIYERYGDVAGDIVGDAAGNVMGGDVFGNVVEEKKYCTKTKVETKEVKSTVTGLNLALKDVLTDIVSSASREINYYEIALMDLERMKEEKRENERLEWECAKKIKNDLCKELEE